MVKGELKKESRDLVQDDLVLYQLQQSLQALLMAGGELRVGPLQQPALVLKQGPIHNDGPDLAPVAHQPIVHHLLDQLKLTIGIASRLL